MPQYDADRYSPPAPIAAVTIRIRNESAKAEALMHFDTGAEISLVPGNHWKRLAACRTIMNCYRSSATRAKK